MLIVPVGGMNALGLFDTNAQVDHERTRLIDLGLDYDLIVGAFIPCVLLALAVIVMPTPNLPTATGVDGRIRHPVREGATIDRCFGLGIGRPGVIPARSHDRFG